jgi:hypothetical protein
MNEPPKTAQQAPLSSSASSALFVESGARCGVFIIPRERDKVADEGWEKGLVRR